LYDSHNDLRFTRHLINNVFNYFLISLILFSNLYTYKKWKIHVFSLYASSIVKNTISCRVELERDAAGIRRLVKMMLYMLHFHHGLGTKKDAHF